MNGGQASLLNRRGFLASAIENRETAMRTNMNFFKRTRSGITLLRIV
jgi:hypothetical protein